MKRLLLFAFLLFPSLASAQCNGIFANNTVCGNITGSSNLPRPTNPSAFLGAAGGLNGQIQYNNAGALGGLTDTEVTARINVFTGLLSGAAPASGGGTVNYLRADGTWAPPTSSAAVTLPQGRITLTSGTPITTTDVVGATTIYYTPYYGTNVVVYNGTVFISAPTGGELSVVLGANWTTNTNYDWFIGYDGATLRFCSGPAWSSAVLRGSGAGTTEITQVSGIYLNANSITCRYGNATTFTCAVQRCTYIGTSRTTGAGQMEDSNAKRFIYNTFNQVLRTMLVVEATASWAYSTADYQQANASAANQLAYIAGLVGSPVTANVITVVLNSTATPRIVYAGIGVDSTTINGRTTSNFTRIGDATLSSAGGPTAQYFGYTQLGYHYLAWLEKGAGTDTQTWFGVSGSDYQTGIYGTLVQ